MLIRLHTRASRMSRVCTYIYTLYTRELYNGEEYAAVTVLIIRHIIRRFLSRFRGERSWKRVFHSKRLTIKFPENKTVIPVEKCDSSLKMQRVRAQTEFNSGIARTNLLLIIAHTPRLQCHRRVFARIHTHIYIYIHISARGKVMKINIAVCGSLLLQSNIQSKYRGQIQPTARHRKYTRAALIRRARVSRSRKHDYYFIAMHQFGIMNIVPIVTGDLDEKQCPSNFNLYVYAVLIS